MSMAKDMLLHNFHIILRTWFNFNGSISPPKGDPWQRLLPSWAPFNTTILVNIWAMVINRHYPIITVYVIFVSKNLSFYERIRCFDILMWCLCILNQIAHMSLFLFLTHRGRVTLICVRKLNPDWFRWWLGAVLGAEPLPELVLIWWQLDHCGWILVKSK